MTTDEQSEPIERRNRKWFWAGVAAGVCAATGAGVIYCGKAAPPTAATYISGQEPGDSGLAGPAIATGTVDDANAALSNAEAQAKTAMNELNRDPKFVGMIRGLRDFQGADTSRDKDEPAPDASTPATRGDGQEQSGPVITADDPEAAATDDYANAYANVDAPPHVKALLAKWVVANVDCRGSSDEATIARACPLRDRLDAALGKARWCYGLPSDESAADSYWHKCAQADKGYDATAATVARGIDELHQAGLTDAQINGNEN